MNSTEWRVLGEHASSGSSPCDHIEVAHGNYPNRVVDVWKPARAFKLKTFLESAIHRHLEPKDCVSFTGWKLTLKIFEKEVKAGLR